MVQVQKKVEMAEVAATASYLSLACLIYMGLFRYVLVIELVQIQIQVQTHMGFWGLT